MYISRMSGPTPSSAEKRVGDTHEGRETLMIGVDDVPMTQLKADRAVVECMAVFRKFEMGYMDVEIFGCTHWP